jgi:hypothetical protein
MTSSGNGGGETGGTPGDETGNDAGGRPGGAETGTEAELIAFPTRRGHAGESPTSHLGANRSLIVRRSLLATAVGGLIPVPVMDDYLAGRIRAGMLMQIAERRRVDLAPSSAELLADPREGTGVRNATLTAATLIAIKLAWRKFFALLAIGRRAEEMATTFQLGTLFDHFCAKLHVGAGLDRAASFRLRGAVHAAVSDSERAAVVGAFRDGARLLGRSVMEAPAWVTDRLQRAAEQYVATGGNPDAAKASDSAVDGEGARWLDRAASLVDERLSKLGSGYLEGLIAAFDRRWQAAADHAAATAGKPRD